MKIVFLVLVTLLPFVAQAQKLVRTYYDQQKTKIQEEYQVSAADNQTVDGVYKRFYENGNLMVSGSFDDGDKSGLFSEFHENGSIARKINYVDGIRHGDVEVYNEEGQPVQKAHYEQDVLTDSIRVFFMNGNVRKESFFVNGKPDGLVT